MPIPAGRASGAQLDTWKAAFDGDPIGREQNDVRRYRIVRPVDDPNYVLLDLEFGMAARRTGSERPASASGSAPSRRG